MISKSKPVFNIKNLSKQEVMLNYCLMWFLNNIILIFVIYLFNELLYRGRRGATINATVLGFIPIGKKNMKYLIF